MGTPKEGEKPQNIIPFTLRVAPEQGRFHGVKTPQAMRQQRADEAREAAKELLGDRWGATVYENPIRVQRPLPGNPGEHRGEPAPLQPIPEEQQAAERLGKPPPEGQAVVFRLGRSQPEQQGGRSRKLEPLPRSKRARIRELIDLYHEEIHLPLLTADLTPEEEAQLNLWANSLSYKELGQEIRKRQEKLDKDFKDQWPPRGLAMP
jgi:hypothetical protein